MMGGISYDTHYKTNATTKQLLREIAEENSPDPIEYSEYQVMAALGALKDAAGAAYAIARAKQLIQEAEGMWLCN